MMLRSLSQAMYQPDNEGHFGLHYPAYAHFTSPIRRYPDLLVHRGIRSLVRGEKSADHVKRCKGAATIPKKRIFPYDTAAMTVQGEHCSMTERRADDATREVQAWLKCEYLLEHVGDAFDGVISAVTSFGLFVELVDIYIEGLVHVTALPGDYYNFDRAHQRLIGERSGRSFQLGGKVRVQVARVDLDDRKIDLELLDAAPPRKSKGRSAGESKRKGKGNTGGKEKAAGKGKSAGGKGKAGKAKKRKTGLRRHH
jgi:ribonuclease R